MEETARFQTQVQRGSGYGYITFPRDILDADDTVRVLVTVNGHGYVTDARALHTGDYMVVFNREQLVNMNVKYGQTVDVELERRDAPPQINDLPTDLIEALKYYAVEEDYKRLPPEQQEELLCSVLEAETPEIRAERVEEIAQNLHQEDPELPRGESL